MKFTCSTVIDVPIQDVIKLWAEENNYKKWQDGFVSIELQEGIKGTIGAKSLIILQQGSRKMELIETILSNNLPYEKKALYEHLHMDNTQITKFIDLDNFQTKYISEIDYFNFKSFLPKIMAFLFPGIFKKQVQKWLDNFKKFAEKSYINNK